MVIIVYLVQFLPSSALLCALRTNNEIVVIQGQLPL